jgi:Dna[CI] antecedent, DciA
VPRAWREPERIGGAVRRQLARFGAPTRIGGVVDAWPSAVGDLVARNAWPARVQRDGTLVVHTKDAVWAFELGHRSAEILGRLGQDVNAIRFVPGPIPEATLEESGHAGASPVRATAEQVEQGAALAAGIADEELREQVAKAAAASLARAADGRSVW